MFFSSCSTANCLQHPASLLCSLHCTIAAEHQYSRRTLSKFSRAFEYEMSGRSKPIKINQDYQSDGDSDDEFDERNDDITVGSLPGSRRSRRMMVSSGGNELYGSLGAHHRLYYRSRIDDDDLSGTHYMARSLPVPRAPYLHSRSDNEIDKRLSR